MREGTSDNLHPQQTKQVCLNLVIDGRQVLRLRIRTNDAIKEREMEENVRKVFKEEKIGWAAAWN